MIRHQIYRWSDIFNLILIHKKKLLIAHLVAVLGALMAVPVPLLMPLLVDEVLLHRPGQLTAWSQSLLPVEMQGPLSLIGLVLFLTLFLRLLAVLFNVWQNRQFSLIAKQVVFVIRRDLLRRLQYVSMSDYESLGSGKVASHLITDLDSLDQFISQSISKFIVALLSLIGTAIVLLFMHWPLALFILFFNPLVIYTTVQFGRRVKQLKANENRAYQSFQQSLAETLNAIEQLRAYHREKYYIDRIIQKADQIRQHSARFAWRSDAAARLSFMVFLFGFDLFRAISMIMVLYSDLSVGEMLAVFAYLWFMMNPVQELLNIQYAYHAANAALQRINHLFDLQLEPSFKAQFNPFQSDRISIQIRDLSFAYRPNRPILNRVNIDIQAGEKVALVGISGGGKSTLIKLLLGLYQPQSGCICYNQVPMDQIGLAQVRQNVAAVLQHPALFNDTVRNNLSLGRHIEESKIWHALKIAQLDELVRDLPQGLETLIGFNGVRLSGGQRQRLAIARMILTEPKVILLDEATSALDMETEAKLNRALHRFFKGRTILIVAHRISSIKQADRVLLFEEGRILESKPDLFAVLNP